MTTNLSTTPEELFMLLGEQNFIRYRLEQQNQQLLRQAGEITEALTKARETVKTQAAELQEYKRLYGELGESNNHDAI